MTHCWCISMLESWKPLRLDPLDSVICSHLKILFQNLDNDKLSLNDVSPHRNQIYKIIVSKKKRKRKKDYKSM